MDIPSGWKSFHLKDVTYESRLRAASENATHLVVFGVNNQTGLSTDSRYHADNLDRYKLVKPGMFAYNPMRLNIGSIGYCNETLGKGLVSPDYVVFGCKENSLDSKYFSYYLQEHQWRNWVQRAGAGSVRIRIYYKDIGIYPIILPPIGEQCKIADILSTWDEAITKTEQLIAALQKRKKGLMQRLLTGEVRCPGSDKSRGKQETKFGNIPTDWQVKKIGQVGRINADTLGGSVNGKKYHYVELSAVDKGNITFPEETVAFDDLPSRARRVPHEYDVIMATVRPNLLAYATWDKELPNYLFSTGFALISPKIADDRDFIYYSLYGNVTQRQIHGLVTGSNYPAINSADVKDLILFWPSNAQERRKIGQIFRALDDEINLLTRKLLLRQQQKKGLMQRLLTGQVRVKV